MFRKFAMALVLCIGTSYSPSIMAQTQTQTMPAGHGSAAMPDMGKTGVIEGNVFVQEGKGHKSPVVDQEISMIVFNNGQQVLMLKKMTDKNGFFTFKNIFMNPDFAYGFGTMYQKNLYVVPRFSITEKDSVKKIDFQIGEGSPYLRDPASMGAPSGPHGNNGSQAGMHTHENSDSQWLKPYQIFALILGIIVLVFGAFFMGRKYPS